MNCKTFDKTMASLPWAATRPKTLDDFDPVWLAAPENKAMVDNFRRLEELHRHIDEKLEVAKIAYRQSAVEEVVAKLRAIQNVTNILAMDEHEQFDIFCRIAEAMNIPIDMREGVLADAIEIVRNTGM
jgi:hypothetical protein